MRLFRSAAIAAIVVAAALGAAAPDVLAQAVGTAGAIAPQRNPDTIVPGTLIAEALKPIVELIAATLATIVAAFLIPWIRNKTGIDVDKAHAAAVDRAISNAAGLVLAKYGNRIPDVDVKNAVLADGIEFVLKATPDAVNHFGLTTDAIRDRIVAKVGLTTAPNTSIPVASPPA